MSRGGGGGRSTSGSISRRIDLAGKTEEVSNSGRSLSADISQKAPQGIGATNVADSKPLISRIAQNKSIFNFYKRNYVVDWMIHVCVCGMVRVVQ